MTPPPDLKVRPARREEGRLIRRLVGEAGAGLDPTRLRWQNFLVAESEGQVVGCAQIRAYPGFRELGSLVVRKAYRGQGIGEALIRALLAREDGVVYLMCRGRMAPYYARFGFEEIKPRQAPWALKTKVRAGQVMASAFGVRLAVMRRARAGGKR
jgi:amino-acid N-acetyltransferase